jgi:hypothetical protein
VEFVLSRVISSGYNCVNTVLTTCTEYVVSGSCFYINWEFSFLSTLSFYSFFLLFLPTLSSYSFFLSYFLSSCFVSEKVWSWMDGVGLDHKYEMGWYCSRPFVNICEKKEKKMLHICIPTVLWPLDLWQLCFALMRNKIAHVPRV